MINIDNLLYMYFDGANCVDKIDSFPLKSNVIFTIYFTDNTTKDITYNDFNQIINSEKWKHIYGGINQ